MLLDHEPHTVYMCHHCSLHFSSEQPTGIYFIGQKRVFTVHPRPHEQGGWVRVCDMRVQGEEEHMWAKYHSS